MAARIPTIATVIINSIRVNPLCLPCFMPLPFFSSLHPIRRSRKPPRLADDWRLWANRRPPALTDAIAGIVSYVFYGARGQDL
jgi:hypothetical protein